MIDRIKKTETYKSLNSIQRDVTMSRKNRLVIENGYNVAKYMGYEAWEKQSGFCGRNKNIVRDLLNQDEK